jgi:hypothetical protein
LDQLTRVRATKEKFCHWARIAGRGGPVPALAQMPEIRRLSRQRLGGPPSARRGAPVTPQTPINGGTGVKAEAFSPLCSANAPRASATRSRCRGSRVPFWIPPRSSVPGFDIPPRSLAVDRFLALGWARQRSFLPTVELSSARRLSQCSRMIAAALKTRAEMTRAVRKKTGTDRRFIARADLRTSHVRPFRTRT